MAFPKTVLWLCDKKQILFSADKPETFPAKFGRLAAIFSGVFKSLSLVAIQNDHIAHRLVTVIPDSVQFSRIKHGRFVGG